MTPLQVQRAPGQTVGADLPSPWSNGGRIQTLIYSDYNADGIRQSSEPALNAAKIFLDVDGDGVRGPLEPVASFNNFGLGPEFRAVPPGTYDLRVMPLAGFIPTVPDGGSLAVNVTVGSLSPAFAFGLHD